MQLRFAYKIWSGYDGFTPASVPTRQDEYGRVRLGWRNYIDVLETGADVFVYFHGPGTPEPGVYLQGRVSEIDYVDHTVWLRPTQISSERPLLEPGDAARIRELVATKGRQVFLIPPTWEPIDFDVECSLGTDGASCIARKCTGCVRWQGLRRISAREHATPQRLRALTDRFVDFVPAYWIIPSRCYLGGVSESTQRVSRLFYDFKTGAASRIHPFALGMSYCLDDRGLSDGVDAVFSIPLSPDKAEAGEMNRTRLLGEELAHLIGSTYVPALRLTSPISKRRPPWRDMGDGQRELEYAKRLEIRRPGGVGRVVLIDDVCTRGATLAAAVRLLADRMPDCEVILATAGQMILKPVVVDEAALLAAGAGEPR